MFDRWNALLAVFLLAPSTVWADGPLKLFATRTQRVCCLKDYGYRVDHLSSPVTGVSFADASSGDTTAVSSQGYRDIDLKRFPLREAALTSDHCQISSVSTVIRRDGTWTMGFRAVQDPELVLREERPKFVRFSQNHFYVTLRVYAGYRLAADSNQPSLARPVVTQFPAKAFWMRRGEIRQELASGTDLQLKQHFDRIDRVEVDLQYE